MDVLSELSEQLAERQEAFGKRLGELAYRRLRLDREIEAVDREIETIEGQIRVLDQSRRDAETARVITEAKATQPDAAQPE